jgi:ADP-ribose pyrophosphatase YjhB (NUDIX family)
MYTSREQHGEGSVTEAVKRRPRPLALCVIWRGREILVFEGRDPSDGRRYYRPLGGGVEWRELSRAAVVREIREELGAELDEPRLLGVLENVFRYDGEDRHEIVFVYEAAFRDRDLYEREPLPAVEADGSPIPVAWVPVHAFEDGDPPLYPEGLLELLTR